MFFFDAALLPVTRWRNGGGETREITCVPAGSVNFEWRASIATIANSGPFSSFIGIERSITLLQGNGVHLKSDDGQIDHRLVTIGEPFVFSGDVALQATLLSGSSQDFNVMSRRNHWNTRVQPISKAFSLITGHCGVIYVLRGQWQLMHSDKLLSKLIEHQGMWWQEINYACQVMPLTQNALVLWADLSAR